MSLEKVQLKSSNFLYQYISDNPECQLEEILNDDEILDLLPYNDEILFKL